MQNPQQDGSGRTYGDPRAVPPLGWCVECLRYGTWLRAAVILKGTSLCATCALGEVGIVVPEDVPDEGRSRFEIETRDRLKANAQHPVHVAGI
jgi:hypothetical protein